MNNCYIIYIRSLFPETILSCTYRVFVRKPEEKRQLERPRRRWKDNIKMDLQEVEYGGMD
jgi:hypothetical protein